MDQLSPFSHVKFLINSALATELFINKYTHNIDREKVTLQALFRFSDQLVLGIQMKAVQPPPTITSVQDSP